MIRQDVRADYVAVPALLDGRGTDVVLIEHEYGIFGGEAGSYVLSLVRISSSRSSSRCTRCCPIPRIGRRRCCASCAVARALVTVFTETARRMIVDSGVASGERVRVVPHGAPPLLLPPAADAVVDPRTALDERAPTIAHLEGRTVLSTFGLISAGKGIETAIEALPAIVPLHPDVLYLVAGQTHPEVVKEEGERYRLSLERLVRDHGLERNVQFLDRFLSEEELAFLLSSTDLYLTPYRSREQIVSGALTFAVVAGCPVVSTPYFYAEDLLLASGAGVLVPFDDPAAFAKGVLQLLDHPRELATAAAEGASRRGWPGLAVGRRSDRRRAAPGAGARQAGREVLGPGRVASSPSIRSDHLLTLVDDVGIVQHADGVVPNRASGYCVDDVARLVIVALGLDREPDDRTFSRMVTLGPELSCVTRGSRPAPGDAQHDVLRPALAG